MKWIRFIWLMAFLTSGTVTFGQRLPTGGAGGFGSIGSGGGAGGGSIGLVTRDTSDIYYFYANNPNVIFPFEDSLLHQFQQYDPIRQQEYDYAHLGNVGSAHFPLFYQPSYRMGFDVGLHQFDLYKIKTEDIRYYKIEQAYTQAGYSQGQTQSDALTHLRFSRNFSNGLNFTIEHRRFNNAGAFDFQRAVNSDVAVGLWYHNKYGTYDAFFSLVTNSVAQQDNGGITTGADTTYEDAFRLDVNLLNSNTRYSNQESSFTQYFYLNKIFSKDQIDRRSNQRKERKAARVEKKEARRLAKLIARDSSLQDSLLKDSSLVRLDSLSATDSLNVTTPPPDSIAKDKTGPPKAGQRPPGPPGRRPPTAPDRSRRSGGQQPSGPPTIPESSYPGAGSKPKGPEIEEGRLFTLYHQMAWLSDSYKFSALPTDSVYYGDFWVDQRGLRHSLAARQLKNTVKLQTFKIRSSEQDSTGRALPAESDLLEVGLVHKYHLVDQEPLARNRFNNLFLTGSFNFSPNDRIRVRTQGHLGLASNAGDFRLGGNLFLNLRKIGNLKLEAVNQLSTPSLVHQQFYVSEQLVWDNNFGKTLETTVKATYTLPAFDFSLKGAYHLVNNLIYFDTEGKAQQNDNVVNILQLSLEKDFHAGFFHLENWLGIQQSTSSTLRLPSFYSKHSFYFEGKIFKKVMLTRIGLDARLTTGYTPYGYQPLTGQFFLQNEQDLPLTPLFDAFLSFKVKTFRFFAKVENLLPYLSEAYYYQAASYPLAYTLNSGGLRMGINWRLVD